MITLRGGAPRVNCSVDAEIRFRQSRPDKLNAIQVLQQEGKRPDDRRRLNDAGASKQSDVGVSITDDINNFSPASDGILDGSASIDWARSCVQQGKPSDHSGWFF